MSVQRPSPPPANEDLEITAELPVLDVAAYEAGSASERPGTSDTWIIPPAPRAATQTDDGEADIDRTQVVAPLPEDSAEPRHAEARHVEPRHVEPRQAEGRRAEPRQVEPPRAEPRQAEGRRVQPRQVEPPRAEPRPAER